MGYPGGILGVGISQGSWGHLGGISQGIFQVSPGYLTGYLTGYLRGYIKGASEVSPGYLWGIPGYLQGMSRVSQGYLRGIFRVSQPYLKGILGVAEGISATSRYLGGISGISQGVCPFVPPATAPSPICLPFPLLHPISRVSPRNLHSGAHWRRLRCSVFMSTDAYLRGCMPSCHSPQPRSHTSAKASWKITQTGFRQM